MELGPLVGLADVIVDLVSTGGTPAKRWGRPEDICGAALLLASDAGAYINGHTLYIDGACTVLTNPSYCRLKNAVNSWGPGARHPGCCKARRSS